jgi:hypothetical protein
MENLSEYIPLLVILATIIFSVIGKSKKRGKATQETTLPGTEPGDFLDKTEYQGTLAGDYQNVIDKKPKRQVVNRPETKRKETSYFSPTSETIKLDEEIEENPLYSFDEEDDVRRAIVYAEIINKKQY